MEDELSNHVDKEYMRVCEQEEKKAKTAADKRKAEEEKMKIRQEAEAEKARRLKEEKTKAQADKAKKKVDEVPHGPMEDLKVSSNPPPPPSSPSPSSPLFSSSLSSLLLSRSHVPRRIREPSAIRGWRVSLRQQSVGKKGGLLRGRGAEG